MSYAVFLLLWILPVIAALALLRRHPAWRARPRAGVGAPRATWALPLVCAIAFVYTTPWDNYLVWRGVWGYGTGRVLGVVGYVPLEEYAFFVLQPTLTGTLLYRWLERSAVPVPLNENQPAVRWVGFAIAVLFSLWGAALLLADDPRGTYLGLILAWAVPVVAGMWLYAGPHLWALRGPVLGSVGAATLYLWIADRYAIAHGIWDIAPALSYGHLRPFGLPVEEAVFFLVTNLLAVFGTVLFLHGDRIRPFWLPR